MTSFDRVEAAQRVRDAISKQAKRIVQQDAPKGLVGRVVTLDPRTLRGKVWFPGDDAPVDVNFFSTNLPASWQEKDGNWTDTEQTSTQGHGSTVVVQRFNGKLWVTDVLSGGQFGFRAMNLGMSLVDQYPNIGVDLDVADNQSGIVGVDKTDSWMSVLVGYSQTIGELSAVEFGPFDFWSGGYWEVRVGDFYGDEGAKVYKFNLAGHAEMRNAGGEFSGWWRVLPDKDNSSDGDTFGRDWDFDIGFRLSEYSLDEESREPTYGLWMRITQQTGSSSMVYQVSMKTRSVSRPGGNTTGQDFAQKQVVNPEDPVGYLGFHNAFNAFEARGNYTIMDTFSRPAAGNWARTPTAPDTADGIQWGISSGSASDYGIMQHWLDPDDTFGENYAFQRYAAVGAQTRRSLLGSANYGDVDLTGTFSCESLPVGGNFQFYWIARWKNGGSDHLLCRFDINPAGDGTLVLSKSVAGVFTTVGSNVPVTTGMDAEDRMCVRVQIRGGTVRMKGWVASDPQPVEWMKTEVIADASLLTPGQIGAASSLTGTVSGPATNTARWHHVTMELRRIDHSNQNNGDTLWSSGSWRAGLVRLGNDLQNSWICEGLFTWNGTHLKWNDPIWMLGVGANRNGLYEGLAGVECPPDGASVPMIPNFIGGGDFRDASADGINLLPGDALYVGIEPAAKRSIDSLSDFLFVVDGSSVQQYALPEWAVLIASVSPTGNLVRLGNGEHVSRCVAVQQEDLTQFTFNNTTAAPGTPVVGVSFVAPACGKADLLVSAAMASTVNGNAAIMAYEFRLGPTIGSGTLISGADMRRGVTTSRAVVSGGAALNTASYGRTFTNLIPWSDYNVRLVHWMNTAGSGTMYGRLASVKPLKE